MTNTTAHLFRIDRGIGWDGLVVAAAGLFDAVAILQTAGIARGAVAEATWSTPLNPVFQYVGDFAWTITPADSVADTEDVLGRLADGTVDYLITR